VLYKVSEKYPADGPRYGTEKLNPGEMVSQGVARLSNRPGTSPHVPIAALTLSRLVEGAGMYGPLTCTLPRSCRH
jgi:hypothetical protein